MAGQQRANRGGARLVSWAILVAGLLQGALLAEAAEPAAAKPGVAIAEDPAPPPPEAIPSQPGQPAPKLTPRGLPSAEPAPSPSRPDQGLPPDPGLLASLFGSTAPSRPSSRLFDSPNMFGDFFNNGGDLMVIEPIIDTDVVILDVLGTTDLPLAGGSRRVKVAENNVTLPHDRVYFLYNHFENALEFDDAFLRRSFSVDRYLFGVEKTFCDGLWSVELRMPFSSEMDASSFFLSVDGGHVGNLAILLKRLVYLDDVNALAIGLGIDTPTGDDVTGTTWFTDYVVHNQATHLSPYVGFLRAPNNVSFYQGFLQVDVPVNGNRIELPTLGTSPGRLNEQTLLYLDFQVGRWLYRNRCACWLTGLASVVEFHYTTTLQDADTVVGTAGGQILIFGNSANRMDIANLTVGLHGELANNTLVRVGGVFPLGDGDGDRFFDGEVQVQLERRF